MNNQAFTIKKSMSMPVQLSQAQNGERPQVGFLPLPCNLKWRNTFHLGIRDDNNILIGKLLMMHFVKVSSVIASILTGKSDPYLGRTASTKRFLQPWRAEYPFSQNRTCKSELIKLNIEIVCVLACGATHLVNNCRESIWPNLQGGAGHPSPKDGGFRLGEAEEVVINVPDKCSGKIWARQGGEPPASVVEMTFGSSSSPLHFYDVSLVDGFNIAVAMSAVGGGVGCGRAACEVDLNVCCPSALEVKVGGQVVGCKSACLAMASPKYCCTGEYANPKTCKPTVFAHLFEAICPKAYSYAFDDSES
uniref:Thaumatin-like protein n=1 Tax=Tanacetum cinerariifolium TaxID=118510 RepID=A0A6L2JAG3_TANCI|nr:hypothetical protein [Tanacetum cinerariifolium]